MTRLDFVCYARRYFKMCIFLFQVRQKDILNATPDLPIKNDLSGFFFFVLNAETIKQIRNSDPNRSLLSKVVDPKKSFKEPNCYQKKLKSPQIYYVSSTVHPNFLRNDFLCQVQR